MHSPLEPDHWVGIRLSVMLFLDRFSEGQIVVVRVKKMDVGQCLFHHVSG